METYLIAQKGHHVPKSTKPKRQSLRQVVLQRLEFSISSKLGIWREEGDVQPMKRKRCNTENNIINASPGPVARARLSLGEDSTFVISNHRQLLPSIRINVDDVETTNSENVFENVGHICLCFLLIGSIMKEKFDSSLLNRTKATTSFLLGLTHPMTRNTT